VGTFRAETGASLRPSQWWHKNRVDGIGTELESYENRAVIASSWLGFAFLVVGGGKLLAPAATWIMPMLTPIAVTGLVLTMVGVTITNIAVGQPAGAVLPVVLGVFAALVAWARFGSVAVESRGGCLGAGHVTSSTASF
jgi:hypothetical protein